MTNHQHNNNGKPSMQVTHSGLSIAQTSMSMDSLKSLSTTNSANSDSFSNATKSSCLALAVVGTTIGGTLALTAPFVLQYLRSPLPYMATPETKVRKALEFIEQQRRQRQRGSPMRTTRSQHQQQFQQPQLPPASRHFVDLGSGDGEAVYQALQVGSYTRATGVELNGTLWALSQLRRTFFWTTEQRRRCSFLWQNFFATSCTKTADTVMVFGVSPLMQQLSHKLAHECRPGTFVLSYRFPLPLMEQQDDAKRIDIVEEDDHRSPPLLSAKLIYDEEEMKIYECIHEVQSTID